MRMISIVLAASLLAGTAHGASYTITDLGDLPGGNDFSSGQAINAAGQVTGWSHSSAGYRAFLWDPATGMSDLGALPLPVRESFGTGINDHATVVGASGGLRATQAFIAPLSLGMSPLPGGIGNIVARDINNADLVVGSIAGRATLWRGSTAAEDLNDIIDPRLGWTLGDANAINDDGAIAGTGKIGGVTRAYLLDILTGRITNVGDLPGGLDYSYGLDMNEHGQVVGQSGGAQGDFAFLWDATTGLLNLGTLPGGVNRSMAEGINSFGQVVGWAESVRGLHAFVWQKKTGMVDLNSLIDPNSGLTLSMATAINDRGQIVVNSGTRALLLTPTLAPVPLPAALPAMAVALGGLALMRVRRRAGDGPKPRPRDGECVA